MKRLLLLGVAAAIAAAGGSLLVFVGLPQIGLALPEAPGWEAVSPDVAVGKKVRLEVRLTGVAAPPKPNEISIASTRLDMGPAGMAAMTAPVKAVASNVPGVLAFESDLAMAGQWELKIVARVPGVDAPVAGSVIFTAVDDKGKPDANAAKNSRRIVYYRNPMGLPDVSPVPKKDSMGMDYIPVYEDEVTGPPGSVQVSLDKVQRAGVRTDRAARRSLARSVLATGTVTPDEARLWITSAKFSGFVEKLHVSLTGAKVRAGQPLMTVWIENGDLLRKQADYLTALKSASRGDRDGAVARARRNLETFDFPKDAIDEIARSRTLTRSIVMRSRADGTVIEKPAIEGMRFDTGHMHFKIADLSTVWVIAEVAERDLGLVRVGQRAAMRFTAYPGQRFHGRVAFIYPDLSMATRTGRIRIELPNPDDRIRIAMYADVEIEANAAAGPVLAVPEAAVIDNGERRVVMVAKGDGRYEPRDVETGLRGNGYVEVRTGLQEGEQVVTNGNFLIDAESNLRAALSAFSAQKPEAAAKDTVDAPKPGIAAERPAP